MHAKRFRLCLESLEARDVPALPSAAPSLGPPPAASATVTWVNTAAQLHAAVDNLQSGQTIVVQPGTYQLARPLYVGLSRPVSNVTIRGATDDFGDVVIRGFGMDDSRVTYGVGVYNAQNVTVANVSIGDVYYDAVDIKGEAGARQVRVYHCRLFDTGEQIVKSNTGGGLGADNCSVEYSVLEYTAGPSTVDHGGGTGYTNGISAHRVAGWQVRHNLFRNFHTPDNVANPWSPVVLMWNGSRDTVVEGNTFVDCDRAVALGLDDRTGPDDHQGGVVRNNFVYQRPGLFSAARRANSDAQILVNDSSGTQVYHNTVLTNGNSVYSIEVRWGTGVTVDNNLADAPVNSRNGGAYSAAGNYLAATPTMFRAPAQADLHLVDDAVTRASVIDRAPTRPGATADFDGGARPIGVAADVGADEYAAPPAANSAAFLAADDGTRGSWQGAYGADGYALADGASALPAYATVALSGQGNHTWAASTADPRALQKPGAADRLAATWHAAGAFTIDVAVTGGPRRVALYLLDWDNWGGGRAERVEVLDAATGQVLDTRTASGFQGGRYLAWTVTGHVLFRVTNLNGSSNAVAAGLFFGDAPPAPPAANSAAFLAADDGTRGSWQGAYGADGYALADGASALPAYATVALSGQGNHTWAASTADPRALQKPGAADRLAATWHAAGAFTIDVAVTGGPRRVALYLLDWDNWGGGRAERVEVLDAATGQVLDTRTASGFQGGRYLAWTVTGHVLFRVTNLNGSSNAVAAGLFFGDAPPAPPAANSAAFLAADDGTRGSWQGAYGADGYALADGASALPAYATVALSGQGNHTWAASTADPRALQKPGAADRLAATWHAAGAFTIDVAVTGGPRRVALYLLDWDNWGGGRAERVEVLDAATGQVLDTRTASGFQGGRYLAWTVTGHVLFRVTNLNGSSNAVAAGLFFG